MKLPDFFFQRHRGQQFFNPLFDGSLGEVHRTPRALRFCCGSLWFWLGVLRPGIGAGAIVSGTRRLRIRGGLRESGCPNRMRNKIANRIAAFTCPILLFIARRCTEREVVVRRDIRGATRPIIGGNESARKRGNSEIFASWQRGLF